MVSRQQVLGGAAHNRQLADALLLEKHDSFLQQLNGLDVVALEHLDRAQFFGNFAAFVRKQYAVRVLRILHLNVLVLERELHRIVVEVLEDRKGLVVHDYAVRDARLVLELLQVLHNDIHVLLDDYAALVAPRLARKFNCLNRHGERLLFLHFYSSRTLLHVAWLFD